MCNRVNCFITGYKYQDLDLCRFDFILVIYNRDQRINLYSELFYFKVHSFSQKAKSFGHLCFGGKKGTFLGRVCCSVLTSGKCEQPRALTKMN